MVAAYEDIENWFKRGASEGRKYMIVMCDTFDWSDYPCYYDNEIDARKAKNSPDEMQKVMEIYNLTTNMESQLKQYRAMAL